MTITISLALCVVILCQGSISIRSAKAIQNKKNNITEPVGLIGLPLKRFWLGLFQAFAAVLIIVSAWSNGQLLFVAFGAFFLLTALMVLLVSTPSSPD